MKIVILFACVFLLFASPAYPKAVAVDGTYVVDSSQITVSIYEGKGPDKQTYVDVNIPGKAFKYHCETRYDFDKVAHMSIKIASVINEAKMFMPIYTLENNGLEKCYSR